MHILNIIVYLWKLRTMREICYLQVYVVLPTRAETERIESRSRAQRAVRIVRAVYVSKYTCIQEPIVHSQKKGNHSTCINIFE